MLKLTGMLSRTERIEEFHLKVTRTEKELYEEFLKTEAPEILVQMQQYFAQAKQQQGAIRFDNKSLWSRIENRVDVWFADVCAVTRYGWQLAWFWSQPIACLPKLRKAILSLKFINSQYRFTEIRLPGAYISANCRTPLRLVGTKRLLITPTDTNITGVG